MSTICYAVQLILAIHPVTNRSSSICWHSSFPVTQFYTAPEGRELPTSQTWYNLQFFCLNISK